MPRDIGAFCVSVPHLFNIISEFIDYVFQHVNVYEIRDIQVLDNVMNSLVWAVAFDTLSLLYSANTNSMALLPAIFALENAWIHVNTANSSNEPSNVEPLIDERFGLRVTLSISYVNPYNGYVRFQRDLYNSWLGG